MARMLYDCFVIADVAADCHDGYNRSDFVGHGNFVPRVPINHAATKLCAELKYCVDSILQRWVRCCQDLTQAVGQFESKFPPIYLRSIRGLIAIVLQLYCKTNIKFRFIYGICVSILCCDPLLRLLGAEMLFIAAS